MNEEAGLMGPIGDSLRSLFVVILVFFFSGLLPLAGESEDKDPPPTSLELGHPTFMSPHSAPIAVAGDLVLVVNTPSDTVDVIDAATRRVVERLAVTAQDPRAIAVRNGKLYVLPFESNSKTQLSGGCEIDGELARFLLNVSYPPEQRRAYDNTLSEKARAGFELFQIKGDVGGTPGGNLCGNCHRMPFWVSTNTPGTGMDAPTWRGAYDRFLILPQGRLNIIDFPFYRDVAEKGIPERELWRFS